MSMNKNKGINVADLSKEQRSRKSYGSCVFISYYHEDRESAIRIADSLMEIGINVFLDLNDKGIEFLAKIGDDKGLVHAIEEALSCCTEILILLSDQTSKSWWVPFEVGYAVNAKKKVTTVRLNNCIVKLPTYLEIEDVVDQRGNFIVYLHSLISRYHVLYYPEMFVWGEEVIKKGIECIYHEDK